MSSSRAPPSLRFPFVDPRNILFSTLEVHLEDKTVSSPSSASSRPPECRHLCPCSLLVDTMSSEVVPAVGPRLHRLSTWFDPETAAVVTILLGLFQVLLSVLLAYADKSLPALFLLPLSLGTLIVAGGSFTMASERNPSRRMLRGCAYSNVAGLLGAVLAFCLYCYSLSIDRKERCASISSGQDYEDRLYFYGCPEEILEAYCWSVTLLLLLYDSGAIVLHSLLSVSALKALKTE